LNLCTGWYEDVAELIYGLIDAQKNGHRRFLAADIKHYLSCITKRSI